jgi:hypothetical protein
MVFDAQTLAQSAYEERSAVREIMNIDHFEFFLEAERRLLMEAGVDPSLAAAIIQRCQDGREGASRSEFNTIQFSSALEELRDAVCGILAELRGSIFQQSSPNRLRRRLRASFEGVCGGVIVGLDATALAVSIGLSTAGSAVSGALGAAIVADAIAALRATGSAGQAGVSI